MISFQRPLLSYVIPAFNEAAIVAANLAELYQYALLVHPDYPFEMIVVNDGSADETGILAQAFAARHPNVSVHHHLTNRGLDAAMKTGIGLARGDVIVTLDLDLSCAPYHISLMLRALEKTNATIVLASPYVRGGMVVSVPWLRRTLSAWANRFLSIAVGGKIATLTCMVRAYNAAAIRKLAADSDNMEFNYDVVLAALNKDMPVVEIPARLEWRETPATVTQRRSSMKIFQHAWSVLMAGLRYRPSMLLALPGLIPGLLPLVLAVLLLARPSHPVVVETTVGTVAVQLLSLGFLGVLGSNYMRQRHLLSARTSSLLSETGTQSHA